MCTLLAPPYLLAGSVFQHSWCLLFILIFPLAHYRPGVAQSFAFLRGFTCPRHRQKMTDAASCELQVVILYASVSSDVRHKSDTDALCALFEAKGVPHVMLDGVRCGLGRASHAARSTTPPSFSHSRFCLSFAQASPEAREVRAALFALSSLRAVYPQVFLRRCEPRVSAKLVVAPSADEHFEFLGDWAAIQVRGSTALQRGASLLLARICRPTLPAPRSSPDRQRGAGRRRRL